MDPIRDALAMLGGAAMLGDASVRSYLDFDRIAHAGVPFGAFSRLVAEIDRPEKSVAESIGIARTTFLRRRDEGRFALEESQRVLRLGLIIALGKRALGSASAAGRWLSKPNEALGGRIPLELLQTDFGSRQVEAVLGRALLGGYSQLRVYRVAYAQFSKTPLDGEGSYRYGGRWSSAGTRMAYASSTLSLAMLEFRAHVDVDDFDADNPPKLAYISADLPDDALLTLEQHAITLPRTWRDVPAPARLATIGDAWVTAGSSLGLIVPSVLLPIAAGEHNVLINPAHGRFGDVNAGRAELTDDRRLIRSKRR